MRTTLTLDDDVAARLQRLRPGSGGMKQLVNDLLRLGMDQLEQGSAPARGDFSTETFRLGAKVPTLDNIGEVLASSEADSWR